MAFALSCFASTLTLMNAPTGQTGPYDLLIDDTNVQGVCVTYNIDIPIGYTWQATEYQVTDFADPGVQVQYFQAEWLTQQFASNPNDYAGIHDAIWNIFEPGTFSGFNVSTWQTSAEQNYGSVDPNSFNIYVPNPVNSSQTFLTQNSGATPEPSSILLIPGGIGLIVLGKFKRKSVV